MSDPALDRAAALLAQRVGLRVDGSMRSRLARALRDDSGALTGSTSDLQQLVDRITVQETRFFRDPAHFDVLVRRALPRRRPGVIWSAGCAGGQEAWSLAIALEEAGAKDWRVLATDISREALERTRDGSYAERELAGLSAARRTLYFRRRDDGRWQAGPRLRARVVVRAHNVAEDPPPVSAAVAFCRNVLIYLDADATRRALDTLHAALPHDGWLFIGATEALTGGPFQPQRVDGVYAYRPRRARTPGPAALAAAARDASVAAAHAAAAARRAAAAAPATAEAGPERTPSGSAATDPAATDVGDAGAATAPTPEAGPERTPGGSAAADLAEAGEAHAAVGRFGEAADAFRRAAALAPADPVAHVRLGLALEQAGEPDAATRAYRDARATLARHAAPDLEGWSPAALERLLDERLGAG